MSKCKDCKHNKNICLVCIKDKIYYIGIDYDNRDNRRIKENKKDMIKTGKGLIERNKITTVYDNKITLKDIKEYTNRLKIKCINK